MQKTRLIVSYTKNIGRKKRTNKMWICPLFSLIKSRGNVTFLEFQSNVNRKIIKTLSHRNNQRNSWTNINSNGRPIIAGKCNVLGIYFPILYFNVSIYNHLLQIQTRRSKEKKKLIPFNEKKSCVSMCFSSQSLYESSRNYIHTYINTFIYSFAYVCVHIMFLDAPAN